MRSTPFLLKSIVLGCFVVLMSGFVAYRSGVFDNYFYGSKGGDVQPRFNIDTTKKPDTTPVRQMMPGSKSFILPGSKPSTEIAPTGLDEDFIQLYIQLRRLKKADSLYRKQQEERKTRMSSSKSMVIMEGEDLRMHYREPVLINGAYRVLSIPQVDSLLKEMDKKYPGMVIPDSLPPKRSIMSGSKSGMIWSPDDLKKRKKELKKYEKEQKDKSE